MKAFYELYRDYEDKITISKRSDYTYPPHFHASVEILILLGGTYKVIMDNKTYTASGKSVIISESFCIHSFTKISQDPSNSMLIIVPSAYLDDYEKAKNNQSLKSSIITDENLVSEISFLAENMFRHENNENIKQKYVNVILSLFIDTIGLEPTAQLKSTSIIKNILLYVANNFKQDISLESISEYFGYSTSHLSRLFHSYFNISISRYINNMRIQYIEINKSKDVKLTTLIYDSGFKRPQTYYRNLKYYQSKT